jgi:hypothetical protein
MTATTKVIMDWIASLGWDDRQELGYPINPGPYVPPSPDRLLVITGGGGPGYLTEEASIDGSNFQALIRGAPEDPLGAEDAAQQLDRLILRARFPVQIDGTWIVNCTRVGSGPDPLPWDVTDQRTTLTSNYTIVTGA